MVLYGTLGAFKVFLWIFGGLLGDWTSGDFWGPARDFWGGPLADF